MTNKDKVAIEIKGNLDLAIGPFNLRKLPIDQQLTLTDIINSSSSNSNAGATTTITPVPPIT